MKGGDFYIKVKITRIVIIVFMIILVISLYLFIRDFLEYKESNDTIIELSESVIIEESDKEKLIIDWEKLESINKDIVGWIKIDNTKINYPILNDDDNLKYLKHSYDGKYNSNGSIFTLNSNPFNDNVTVMYGHNMKSGIMFSELGKYMNEEFLILVLKYTQKIKTIKQQYSVVIQ